METLRSPITIGSRGGPLGTEGPASTLPPPSSNDAESSPDLFRREVERGVERAGGERRVEERAAERRREQRDERHGSFERRSAEVRSERGRRERDEPAHETPQSTVPAPGPDPNTAPEPLAAAPAAATFQPAEALAAAPAVVPTDLPVAAVVAPVTSATAPFLSQAASTTVLPAASTPAASGPGEIALRAVDRLDGAARRATARPDRAPEHVERPNLERTAAILRQIRSHLTHGTRRLELELEPRDLGRVSIQLATRDGRLRAIVRAESAETLAALERHVPELTAAFERQGLSPESFEMHLGFTDSEGRRPSFAEREPHHGARETRETHTSVVESRRAHARAVHDGGGLDTWA